jgi:hypothetical protein
MFPLVSGVAMGQGAPALALSVANNGITEFIAEGIIGEGTFPITTGNGAIVMAATASGGDGSYAYSWAVTEQGDTNNIATGNIQLSNAGTQNVATYNDSNIRALETGMSGGDPPIEALYFFTCTVTDGTGATASGVARLNVVVVGLQ